MTAMANTITVSNRPAAIVHRADRLLAHHMNHDASTAPTPAATTTSSPIKIRT